MPYNNQPLISVVTVCYNVVDELAKTIESVVNQTWCRLEYVIVDGGSSDQTIDVIKAYETKALAKGIEYKWISELDAGIYDAMNKGIDIATGDWINFMNAGDCFNSHNTIHNLFKELPKERILTIYGDTMYRDRKKRWLKKARKLKTYYKGMVFCHQSAFIKMTYHKNNKYDIGYKYAGDLNFFYRLYKEFGKNCFFYKNEVVSVFDRGGVSNKHWKDGEKEVCHIVNCLENDAVVLRLRSINIFVARIKRVFKSWMTN